MELEVGVLDLGKKELDPALEFDPALKGEGDPARFDFDVDTKGGASLEDEEEAEGGFNPERGILPKVREIPPILVDKGD